MSTAGKSSKSTSRKRSGTPMFVEFTGDHRYLERLIARLKAQGAAAKWIKHWQRLLRRRKSALRRLTSRATDYRVKRPEALAAKEVLQKEIAACRRGKGSLRRLTSLAADFRAKTSAVRVAGRGFQAELARACGTSSGGWWARYDPSTSSWKTSLPWLGTASGLCLEVFAPSGTMRNGQVSAHRTLAVRTAATASSSSDGGGTGPAGKGRCLSSRSAPSGFPTSLSSGSSRSQSASASLSGGKSLRPRSGDLDSPASPSLFPTPLASDAQKATFSPEANRRNFLDKKFRNNSGFSGIHQMCAGERIQPWRTPTTADAFSVSNGLTPEALAKAERTDCNLKLWAKEKFERWPTPLASTAHHTNFTAQQIAADVEKKRKPEAKFKMADGVHSHVTEVAAVEFGLRPTPLLSLWLMGFPKTWLDGIVAAPKQKCGEPAGTRSSRTSRSTSRGASSRSTQEFHPTGERMDMQPEITVDPEFRSLIPPLSDQELALLREQILEKGCLEALYVWNDGGGRVLLDGHNRHQICAENRVPYTLIEVPNVTSREQAKVWILEHQAGRRNLTDDQRAVVWNDIREARSKLAVAEKMEKARAVKAGTMSAESTEIEPGQARHPERDRAGSPPAGEQTATGSGAQEGRLSPPRHYVWMGGDGYQSPRTVGDVYVHPWTPEVAAVKGSCRGRGGRRVQQLQRESVPR